MANDCEVLKKNLGKSKCNKLPKLPKCMITTPDNFKLQPADYASDAALKTALQTAIKAGIASRIYLWPLFSKVEDVSEQAIYEDTPLSVVPVRDGQYRYKPSINKNLCLHKAMFSHRAVNEGRVFLIDVDNQLFGTEDSAGNIQGFTIGLLHTEKLMISNGSNSTESPIYLVLADNKEIDKSGILIDASVVNTLDRLTDVSITQVGAFSSASFKVDVAVTCDGSPVSGLVLADFLLYVDNTLAATQTIQTVVEDGNIPGRYTLTSPGGNVFETGPLTLRAPSALTVSAYECPTPTAIA